MRFIEDKKQVILAVVGESGSGKTTFTLALTKEYDIRNVVSSTTRPMRKGETDGVEHWFKKPTDVPAPEERLAYTKFGDYEYWVSLEDVKNLGDIFTYVIDEDGLKDLKAHYSDMFDIVSIKIKRDFKEDIEENRKKRDTGRFNMVDEDFDIVLSNDSTIDNLCYKCIQSLICLVLDTVKNKC